MRSYKVKAINRVSDSSKLWIKFNYAHIKLISVGNGMYDLLDIRDDMLVQKDVAKSSLMGYIQASTGNSLRKKVYNHYGAKDIVELMKIIIGFNKPITVKPKKKVKTKHFVYITTCLINKKKYIGKHSTKDVDDGYLGSGINITAAIKQFGSENFSKKIVGYFTNMQDASRAEDMLIQVSGAAKSQLFYNMDDRAHRKGKHVATNVPTKK